MSNHLLDIYNARSNAEPLQPLVSDPADFKMPYRIYGEIDRALMYDRYGQLTNSPKNPLQVRFVKYGTQD